MTRNINMGTEATVKWPNLPGTSPVIQESDPSGKNPHEGGAKLDSGKVRPSLVFEGFARALWAVSSLATKGADKYTDNGWAEVPDGFKRYTDAMDRHRLKEAIQEYDPDSKELEETCVAWNALCRLELKLRAMENDAKLG